MNKKWKTLVTSSCLAGTLLLFSLPLTSQAQFQGGPNFNGGPGGGFNGPKGGGFQGGSPFNGPGSGGFGGPGFGGQGPGSFGGKNNFGNDPFFQQGGGQMGHQGNRSFQGGGPGGGQLLQKIGLSKDQRTQIKKLQQTAQGQAKPLRQELQQKRQELMQYISTPQADLNQALSIQRTISDRQTQLSELRVKTWFQMRTIMTPEQVQKLTQLKAQGLQQRSPSPGGQFGGPPGGEGFGEGSANPGPGAGFPPENTNE